MIPIGTLQMVQDQYLEDEGRIYTIFIQAGTNNVVRSLVF